MIHTILQRKSEGYEMGDGLTKLCFKSEGYEMGGGLTKLCFKYQIKSLTKNYAFFKAENWKTSG